MGVRVGSLHGMRGARSRAGTGEMAGRRDGERAKGAGRESLLGLTAPWIIHPRAQARLSEHGRLLGRGMHSGSACNTLTPPPTVTPSLSCWLQLGFGARKKFLGLGGGSHVSVSRESREARGRAEQKKRTERWKLGPGAPGAV